MTFAQISATAILVAFMVGGAAQAANNSATNPLVGSWRLTSLVNKDANGNLTYPWGAKPVGMFVFGQDGNFAEMIINEEKPNASVDYFGTYSVENGKVLRLHVVGCSSPQFRGQDIERQITLSSEQLSYGNTNTSVGGSASITWDRVK
jgi:Lipocalin-like domain